MNEGRKEVEIWKDIPEYEGRYQVSNLGNVKTLTRLVIEHRRTYIRNGKILNQYNDKAGYYKVKLYNGDGSFLSKGVHQLVASLFIPNPNNYPQVNHIDGNPRNNEISNLEWCSNSQNTKHAYSTGLKKIENYTGEANNWAKLTKEDVLNIRKDREMGLSLKSLSNKYNTRIGNISFIIIS